MAECSPGRQADLEPVFVLRDVEWGDGGGRYLLKKKLWKCCMSDEDDSASAFVMQ